MVALKKEAKCYKMQKPSQISPNPHTAKTVARKLRGRIERKIYFLHGEDQFGFRREKGTMNAIGMLRIITE
jgi:hypothetical protein